jgi:hypothetical protein
VPDAGSEGSQLTGVTALSANDVRVTGVTDETDGGALGLNEQFNGTSWSIAPGLEPGELDSLPANILQAITPPGRHTVRRRRKRHAESGVSVLVEEDTTAG